MDGSLKASTQNWERLGKEGEDACTGEVHGWGGFRKDVAWGRHRGALDCGRCEEEGDEGVTIHYFIFFHSLLSSQAAGLKPGAIEGGGRSALGRVKPTPAHPGYQGHQEALDAGLQKAGCFLHLLPEHPPVCCWRWEGNQESLWLRLLWWMQYLRSVPRGEVSSPGSDAGCPCSVGALLPPSSQLGFQDHLQLLRQSAGGVHVAPGAPCLGCDGGPSACGNTFQP